MSGSRLPDVRILKELVTQEVHHREGRRAIDQPDPLGQVAPGIKAGDIDGLVVVRVRDELPALEDERPTDPMLELDESA